MARVRVFNPSPTRKNLFGFGRSREVSGPQPGDSVKVRFSKRGESELMWVQVTGKRGKKYSGVLDNEPVVINKQIGDRVSFSKSQIIGNNPSDATTTQRSNSMQRRVRTNQQQPAASSQRRRDGHRDRGRNRIPRLTPQTERKTETEN
jgi:hypothetical protein